MKIKLNKFKEAVNFCNLTLQKGQVEHETTRLYVVEGKLKLHSFNSMLQNIYTFNEEDIEDLEGLNIYIPTEKLKAIVDSSSGEQIRLKLENNAVCFFIPSKRQIGLVPEDVLTFPKFEEVDFGEGSTEKVDFTILNKGISQYKDIISKSFIQKEFEHYFYDGMLFSTTNSILVNTVKLSDDILQNKLEIHYATLPSLSFYSDAIDVGIFKTNMSISQGNLTTLLTQIIEGKGCPNYRDDSWKTKFEHVNQIGINKEDTLGALKKLSYFAKIGNTSAKIELAIENKNLKISTIGDDSAEENMVIKENSNNIKIKKYVSYNLFESFLSNLPTSEITLGIRTDENENETRNISYIDDDMTMCIMEMKA